MYGIAFTRKRRNLWILKIIMGLGISLILIKTNYIKSNDEFQGLFRNYGKLSKSIDLNTTQDLTLSSEATKQIFYENECEKLDNFTANLTSIPNIFAKTLTTRNILPSCGQNGLLEPWRYTEENKGQIWMLFLVKSAPSYYRRRVAIRETWAYISSLRGMKFATIFLLARTDTSEKQDLLQEENDLYGDMLQCDFLDSYKSLPTKVLSGFDWLVQGHVTSDYVTVTDDDCVMNLVNILVFFRAAQEDAFYCGFVYDDAAAPQRTNTSKWFISEEVYPGKLFPTFCHGGMWTIPFSYVLNIKCVAEITNRNNFYLEDVYITGILRSKLASKKKNIKKVETDVMYYTWDEGDQVYLKLATQWHRVNKTLPWRDVTSLDAQPIITTYSNYRGNDFAKENLSQRWRKK